MSDTGIYILTYPGDYHLSKALIRSLKFFNPDIPIMIIPGEGVNRDDHPFDVPLMPTPGGFWEQMKHIDRKFWAFQGPFEKFLYVDADIICTRSIMPFLEQLGQQDGKFINVQMTINDEDWSQSVDNVEHERHELSLQRVRSQIGNVDVLKDFDPDYDPYAHYPFNAGLFASSRLAIDEKAFESLHKREQEFFKKKLDKEFAWNSHDLFFADQGRLNYLVDQLNIPRKTLYPYGQYYWGGRAREFLLDQVLAGKSESNFIHWAGCPRPSPSLYCRRPLLPLLTVGCSDLPAKYKLLKEIPGYSVWKHFSSERQNWWKDFYARLSWTGRDTRRILYSIGRRLLMPIKQKL